MSQNVISMYKAKSSLSQLVKLAASGETVLIGSYGHVEAALTSPESLKPKKRLGLLEGKLVVPDSFDDPLPSDILAAFEGNVK